MENQKTFDRRNRTLNTISRIPILGFTDNSDSDSSSSEDFPKLAFEKHSSLRKNTFIKVPKKKVSFKSNENINPKKQNQKSKFYTIQNKISNSKLKSLEIFEENFNLLKDEIEREYNENRRVRSKSTMLLKKPRHKNTEERLISLTNMEIISDFYEYTENCMKLICDLEPKEKQKNKIPSKTFIFNNNINRKKIAVFDLDETLIHCVGDIKKKKKEEYQEIISVVMPTRIKVDIGINIRPHWKESILKIKNKYFIVAYTASHNNYADAVLNYLDPQNNIFEGRLYRKDCILCQIGETKFYVKDLNIFQNFDLKDIVLIDNSVLSFAYHLNNGIPIVPYYNSKEDSELIFLSKYLLYIADFDDLRECNKEFINIESFLEQAKKEKNKESLESSDSVSDSDNDENNNDNNNENENNNNNVKVNVIDLDNDNKDNYINIKNININNILKENINEENKNDKKDDDKIIFNKKEDLRPKSERHFQRRERKKTKLNTHVFQKRPSLIEDEFTLNFSKEDKAIQIPKHFKRRNRTIRYKLQTMMNQMHNKFFNTIININPSL